MKHLCQIYQVNNGYMITNGSNCDSVWIAKDPNEIIKIISQITDTQKPEQKVDPKPFQVL